MQPSTIEPGRTTLLHLSVETESPTASSVTVDVGAPPGLSLTGTTSWRGRTRTAVALAFRARAVRTGDYTLRVRQTYSDGKVVNWRTAVVHVRRPENTARDRTIIVLVVAAAIGAWALLRRRPGQRS